ncbi:hypothetical protein Tco_1525487 [Tanacetum coccineum]
MSYDEIRPLFKVEYNKVQNLLNKKGLEIDAERIEALRNRTREDKVEKDQSDKKQKGDENAKTVEEGDDNCEEMKKNTAITELKRKLNLAQKEKDGIQFTVENFKNLSKSLKKLIDSQMNEKYESWTFDDENMDVCEPKIQKQVHPSFPKIKFVKAKDQNQSFRKPVKYAEMYRSQRSRGNQRNWNGMMSQRNFAKKNHLNAKRNQVLKAALTVNAARQNLSKAAVTVNTARPITTTDPKRTMNAANQKSQFKTQTYSFDYVPIQKEITLENTPTTKKCIKQFWTPAKVKTVNDEFHVQDLVDEKRIIVKESSIRNADLVDMLKGLASSRKSHYSARCLRKRMKKIKQEVHEVRKEQIQADVELAKELEAEWNDVIEQVQRRDSQEDDDVMKYQALKRKPLTIAQARRNMMIYLKNMAG